MRYLGFRQALREFGVFSLNDIRKIDADFDRRRLSEWQAKGYIRKIIRGYYMFADIFVSEHMLFEISCRIYGPSYMSLESALAYYSLIPEIVYGVTAVSTRKTSTFSTQLAEFTYRKITPRLFFGYDIINEGNTRFKIACPEKAVLDYLYFRTEMDNTDALQSMRINRDAAGEKIDMEKLAVFSRRIGSKALARRARLFQEVYDLA